MAEFVKGNNRRIENVVLFNGHNLLKMTTSKKENAISHIPRIYSRNPETKQKMKSYSVARVHLRKRKEKHNKKSHSVAKIRRWEAKQKIESRSPEIVKGNRKTENDLRRLLYAS